MYLNNYSVRIPEGHEDPSGYVELSHNTQYTLVLRNAKECRCDARVEVDGKHVGTWRLDAGSSFRLERPTYDEARFTFYRLDSKEAEQIGLNGNDPNLGLVKVTFTPEARWKSQTVASTKPLVDIRWNVEDANWAVRGITSSACGGYSSSVVSYTAGGTGLSGHSRQEFQTVAPLEYDYSGQTVIHLRLVCKNGNEPRPLTSYSTPVPPPVR